MHPTEFREIPADWKKKKLSVLMPFLNEEKIIVQNARETVRILRELDINFEIILIDDGSKDLSFQLLEKEFKDNPDVKVIQNFQNFGKGWALKTGYEYTSGDLVLFMDSDLELSPYHIPNFYRVMREENADAVIGSKLHTDSKLDYPSKRKILSMGYYTIIRLFFGLPVMDTQTGFKLFKKEALEKALPKVLVKKFAFDIELLIILCKNKKKISSAPIELKFSRGAFGRMKMKTVISMMTDTLAVFYRDKILGFYNRPLGENISFQYTFILFPEHYDEFEKESLNRFLDIHYENYLVIILGKNDLGIKNKKMKFYYTEEPHMVKRLKDYLTAHPVHSDYIVFSRLCSYPDKRFLFTVGRIFSDQTIGGAGGFVTLRNSPGKFEKNAFNVLQSFFLNLNLIYRFKPMNFQEVGELQLDGLFVRKDVLSSLEFQADVLKLKLEYIISKQVKKQGLKLVYTPDLFLYRRFPETSRQFFDYIRSEAGFRAGQFKTPLYQKVAKLNDKKFILSLFLILLIGISVGCSFFYKNPVYMAPIGIYYFLLLLSRLFLNGFKKGFSLFFFLSAAQIVYGMFFISGLFYKNK